MGIWTTCQIIQSNISLFVMRMREGAPDHPYIYLPQNSHGVRPWTILSYLFGPQEHLDPHTWDGQIPHKPPLVKKFFWNLFLLKWSLPMVGNWYSKPDSRVRTGCTTWKNANNYLKSNLFRPPGSVWRCLLSPSQIWGWRQTQVLGRMLAGWWLKYNSIYSYTFRISH